MHDDFPPVRAHRLLEGGVFMAPKARRVDEIGNDLNGSVDLEMLFRFAAKVFGNGGDAVGMVDGVVHHGREPRVLSHQRNVRAVECGEYRHAEPLLAQNVPGQHSAGGMGNGVMHVQEVQVLELRHIDHFSRQRQRIGGIFEEGVGIDRHLVKGDVFRNVRQPERHGVGDEMNLMSSQRKGLA